MAPLYKIALIQFQPKPLDLEANFAHAAAAIRDAAAAGAQLAVLPEYHLTSWVPEESGFVAACAASGAFLARYQALARELDVSIVPGTLVEAHVPGRTPSLITALDGLDGPDDPAPELRNMAYYIAAGTGAVLGRYQKTNLWHPERAALTAPTRLAAAAPDSTVAWPPHSAFDTPWTWGTADPARPDRPVRVGLLVCWDLAFPEAFRALVADGADLIVVPSFWSATDVDEVARQHNPDCERLFLQSTLVARAYESTCAIAFCNAGGVSMLAQPIVGGRGEIAADETRTSLVDFDVDLLRLAEENYKVRADMQRADWHYAHTLKRE